MNKICLPFYFFILITSIGLFAQTEGSNTASRTSGETVHYYATLHEAFEAAEKHGGSQSDEISLLADIVLDEPLIIENNVHITLVAVGAGRTIKRGAGNVEFPMIWVKGDNSSLSLGKPGMAHELVFDGGYLNVPSILAEAPIAAVSGTNAKLIMYDGVTLQNNCNVGAVPGVSHYQNGTGVFIRTESDSEEHQAEFIMKGGIIKGNINDVHLPIACGGGVMIAGFGIFYMEGGTIMNNTVRDSGGGVHLGSRASFHKTGGIIYGKDAPVGLRNTALKGNSVAKTTPITRGHAVSVAVLKPLFRFRDDTVNEDDNLSYTGSPKTNGVFGADDKWDNSDRAHKIWLVTVILPILAFSIAVFLIVMKAVLKKRMAKLTQMAETAPEINLEDLNLSKREKEICKLLLTELTFKEIASLLKLSNSGVTFHSQNLYRKLGIQSRTELFVKLTKK